MVCLLATAEDTQQLFEYAMVIITRGRFKSDLDFLLNHIPKIH